MKIQFTCPVCGGHFLIRTVEQQLEYISSELHEEQDGSLRWAETPPMASVQSRLLKIRCAECGRIWPDTESLYRAGALLPHPMNGKRCVNCTVYAQDGSATPVNLIIREDHELTPQDMVSIRRRILGDAPGFVVCPEYVSGISSEVIELI
ncbi:MAG: hypothetical protein ACI4OS_02130 [Akkermansia sp.]